jgi:hypothetical protein
MRFLEFFAANIRDPHTRHAFARVTEEFLTWCAEAGLPSYPGSASPPARHPNGAPMLIVKLP